MKEAVSILIPAFNREKYIAQCLESIFCQTFQPLEIIVYDDGSTDRTVEVVRKFPEVHLLEGRWNRGAGYARNQLLRACTTRYAAWQDSDDLSNIYRIEEQYHALKKTGKALGVGCCIRSSFASPGG